jgi:AbrB family transcriptional regulator (stage V sporulation protein T)
LGHFAQEYAEALFDSLHCPVAISDRDEIIAISGESKKDYLKKPIGSKMAKTMEDRTQIFEKEPETLEVTIGNKVELKAYCISPIIANGDAIGSVMVFSKEDGKQLGEVEQKAVETAAGFLAKQME